MPTHTDESAALGTLRQEVREFLMTLPATLRTELGGVDTWLSGWNIDFTRALAERGWIGMTIPREYGGHARTHLERFVVTEELLAAGAPVAAHWIADRQVAPTLLRFGTEEVRREFLPEIAAGRCYFGIGMSEPDSGSDLASVRTKAHRVDGGWTVSGTKLWTSGGHLAHAFIALVRTAPLDASDRHAGLSQLLVRLDDPGVDVRPVISAGGHHHFNEVVLDDVFVPDHRLVGEEGDGWMQVTSELSFERSGPERFLSTMQLFEQAMADPAVAENVADVDSGRQLARLAGLHEMSRAVAGSLQRGEEADVSAALVKVLGTTFEGDLAEWIDQSAGSASGVESRTKSLATRGVIQRPGFTLRGGTNEILRGVIARGLGMR
ncbi:acyl-CoA dehydrogenase family protein [Nocardioides sp. JQ2195]|uniref:acyl-CoA dehydrogenase family protein n=1 Tax=Nocardioides sp. JQ2195 TaxID=2592334 RepID=UPI001F0F24C2|nr:acyl-CoA dehydrogenase family protein [Nocardioides sp. JQ2195]